MTGKLVIHWCPPADLIAALFGAEAPAVAAVGNPPFSHRKDIPPMSNNDGGQYLIAHIGHTNSACEHVTWWKPDSRGYTMCIDKAGLYSEAEARDNCRSGSCIAVPKSVAEALSRSTPYYRRSDGTLNKMYDGGPHRVVPNERVVWQYLLSGRLHGCAHPAAPPTPISQKKARAIYVDGIAA